MTVGRKPRGRAAVERRVSRAKAERLAEIERQIAEGSLRIRQATATERERYGIRDAGGEEDDREG